MKASNNYRPSTRSRYAYHAILDRISDLSYEHARMIQERLARHVNTVALDSDQAQSHQAEEAAKEPSISYRQEYTRCGKTTCKTCQGGEGHGPYWYSYSWEGGKTKKRYVGKELPEGVTA